VHYIGCTSGCALHRVYLRVSPIRCTSGCLPYGVPQGVTSPWAIPQGVTSPWAIPQGVSHRGVPQGVSHRGVPPGVVKPGLYLRVWFKPGLKPVLYSRVCLFLTCFILPGVPLPPVFGKKWAHHRENRRGWEAGLLARVPEV